MNLENKKQKEPKKNQKKFCYNKELLYFCPRIEFLTLKKGGKKGDKEEILLRLKKFLRHIKAFLLIFGNLKPEQFQRNIPKNK